MKLLALLMVSVLASAAGCAAPEAGTSDVGTADDAEQEVRTCAPPTGAASSEVRTASRSVTTADNDDSRNAHATLTMRFQRSSTVETLAALRATSQPGALFRGAIAGYRALARYSRFETSGVEHLASGEPGMLVGYHGRPHALDYFYLCALMHDRYGTFPRAVVRSSLRRIPVARQLMDQAGVYYGAPDDDEIARLRARRDHLYVCPGGLREGLRPFWKDRYRVSWGERRGYLRLAARHRLPIYPCAAIGVDEAYLGLHDGHALAKRLGVTLAPMWLAMGVGIWPLALPLPVRIVQRIGPPIELAPLRARAASDETFERDAHELVQRHVQGLLDDLLRERSARRNKGAARVR